MCSPETRQSQRLLHDNGTDERDWAARFVALPGQNHLFLENEPACPMFFDELDRFLKE